MWKNFLPTKPNKHKGNNMKHPKVWKRTNISNTQSSGQGQGEKDKPEGQPVAIATELLGPLLPYKANVVIFFLAQIINKQYHPLVLLPVC